MAFQPEIKVVPKSFDKCLEIVGWTLLAIIWILFLVNTMKEYAVVSQLPLFIFNFELKSLLTLTLIGSMIFLAISLLMRFPSKFNYPVKITSENAEEQYALASRLLSYYRAAILLLFIFISVSTDGDMKSTLFLIIITFVLIFIPMMLFIGKMFRIK